MRKLVLLTLPRPVKWGATGIIVLAAFFLRFQVLSAIPSLPMLFFLPAILASAIFFGRSYGLSAVVLSSLLADYYFLPPVNSFVITSPLAGLSLTLFVLVGLLVALMGSALRNAYREAEDQRQRTAVLHQQAEIARAQAEAGERERQLLLVEFGHRVKNDMQRITSTLQLRARHASPEVAAALKQTADQIHTVAALHDRLAHHDGEVLVEMQDYLQDLVAGLRGGVAEMLPIGLFVEAEEHSLPLEQAGAVGLIVNELVTNALKHAFPDDRQGRITITFTGNDADYLLSVADDGVGLPEPVEAETPAKRGGLGRRLIRALAAQLGGKIESAPGPLGGTVFSLRFGITP